MSAIRGFVGLLIVVILGRLAMMVLETFLPLELVIVLVAGVVIVGGAIFWYVKRRRGQRQDREWREENQDRINIGRRKR